MHDIIEAAYQIFSGYQAGLPLDICTECCMTSRAASHLASLPVRAIPQELLREYNDGASTDKTPVHEIKHFLPRYLELVSQLRFPSHSAELSFRRLTPFDPSEWSASETNLLNRFSLEYFKHCLSVCPLPAECGSIDAILIMLWRGSFDIDILLKFWATNNGIQSILHYQYLYPQGFSYLNSRKLANQFGDEHLSLRLINWANQAATKRHFSTAIEELTLHDSNQIAPRDAEQLSVFYDILALP